MPRVIVTLNGETVFDRQLSPGSYSIGRKEANDIHLQDASVSGTHARLVVGADTVVDDLCSTNGTLLNGEQVDRAVLTNGDLLGVGQYEIKYFSDGDPRAQAPEATPREVPALKPRQAVRPGKAQDAAAYAYMEVLEGGEADERIVLDKPFTAVGKIGVRVAVITKGPRGYGIRPVSGDQEPVRVNGEVLGIRMRSLSDGDRVELAGMVMVFHHAPDKKVSA